MGGGRPLVLGRVPPTGNDTWTDDTRIDEYWRRYHSFILSRLGVDARNEVLDRLLESQFTAEAWELYPDVEPMLVAVREMGVRIGVVSDWGSNLRDILAGLELDRYLDFVLPSGAVGMAKPNPAFSAWRWTPWTFDKRGADGR